MDDGYCLSRSYFRVAHDRSSYVTDIDYQLGQAIGDPEENLDLLRTLAEKIGFDIKREEVSKTYAAVFAADGGELRAHSVFVGSEGAISGTSTEIEINGWSNESDGSDKFW